MFALQAAKVPEMNKTKRLKKPMIKRWIERFIFVRWFNWIRIRVGVRVRLGSD
jgi:hypothetical protein